MGGIYLLILLQALCFEIFQVVLATEYYYSNVQCPDLCETLIARMDWWLVVVLFFFCNVLSLVLTYDECTMPLFHSWYVKATRINLPI